MDNGKPIPAGVWVLYLGMAALYLIAIAITHPIFSMVLGTIAGSLFILLVVRQINRRLGRNRDNRQQDVSCPAESERWGRGDQAVSQTEGGRTVEL
jgi:hypothetical protein